MTIHTRRPPLELLELPSVIETLPDYLGWLRGRKLSEETVEAYSRNLRAFVRWLEARLSSPPQIGDIVTPAIEAWQAEHAHLATRSIIKTLTALRSHSLWLIRTHRRADDPTLPIAWPRKGDAVRRFCSSDDLERLEAALEAPLPRLDVKKRRVRLRDRRALLIMLYLSARRSEVVSIQWSDVDLAARTVTI
jgi:site-specific recombinase XerD